MKGSYDPINTGKIIRQLRKEKNMTLQSLSDGICSIGKMSYIENGHSTTSDIELEQIAKKLNTTLDFLKSPSMQEEVSFSESVKDIELLLSLNLLEVALGEIERIKEEYKDFIRRPATNIPLLYLEGTLHRKLQNESISLAKFYQLLESPILNKTEVYLRSKTYSQLGELEYRNNKFSMKTIEAFKKAKSELTDYKLDVHFSLDYNLSVLYLYQREYSTSKSYINLTAPEEYKPHSMYMDALITLFTQDVNIGLRKIDQSRYRFMEIKQYDMMLKTIFASMYFKLQTNSHDKKSYILSISNFVKTSVPSIDLNNPTQLQLFVSLLQSIILFFISERDEESSVYHYNWLEKLEVTHNYLERHEVTLTLKACMLKRFHLQDVLSRKTLLLSILDRLEKSRQHSFLKIHILAELGEMNGEKDSYSYRALETSEYLSGLSCIDYYYFDLFMPDIIGAP